MPNTLYKYSAGLGMVKRHEVDINEKEKDTWYATQDQAMIFYLNEQKESVLDGINKLTQSLKENNKELKRIEKELQPYKDKYPEEFL